MRDAWVSLTDEAIRILQATGEILVVASEEYQATDEAARQKFDDLKPDVIRAQQLAEEQSRSGVLR